MERIVLTIFLSLAGLLTVTATPARELPADLERRVELLVAAGDARLVAGDLAAAIDHYGQALARLPVPADQWDACLDLHIALGDTHWLAGHHEQARTQLEQALACPGGDWDVFARFRLGQAHLELGDCSRAGEELLYALTVAGPEIFVDEHPKYLAVASAPLAADMATAADCRPVVRTATTSNGYPAGHARDIQQGLHTGFGN